MSKRKHDDAEEEEEVNEGDRSIIEDEEGGFRFDDIYVPPPPVQMASIDNTGPRLIISKIANTNFKSYGETQILGPFHKNFNAVVGSNGSGKSNVIDALLFVFGYRASKIRSKKLSVLIHKSSKYNNVSSCSVSVHFTQIKDKEDDPSGFEVIPGTEFAISRTANKDNSSYYQINDKKVQYRDIALLLRKHWIDLDHNRFLILQGEVEQISLMKPKGQNEHETGMLEYLEDIIGTNRFKVPIEKLNEKIEILTEQRSEKLNRVRMAEKEKNTLKEPMEEAVQYLELENEITVKYNFLHQKYIHEINKELQFNEEEESSLADTHDKIKENLNSITQETKEFSKSSSGYTKNLNELNKRKDKLSDTFDKANNRDISLQAELVQVNKRRKKVIETLKQEKHKLENYENVPEKSKKDIEEYEAKEVELQEKLTNMETKRNKLLVSLGEETSTMTEKKEKLQTKLIGLRKTVDETKSEFNIADSELKLYVANEEKEQKKLETLKATIEENKQKLGEYTKTVKELKQKIPLTEKSLSGAISELEKVKLDEANCIQEIKTKRMKIEELRCSLQASKSRNKVLDSLMQQKKDGKMTGVFGRLGDLGAIDVKYDVAVSTACGPLDNIVVDTVDTAQQCIEYLKTHNLGRGTFIALEKQEHLRNSANSRIQTPENVPRLFDLIKVEDERVRTAFYYALRDTLVANSIDQATRIAYGAKRYRVVTLKGELIETSGTMSGGGKTVLRGRMGQSVATHSKESSADNIETLESNLSELEQKCKNLHQKQINLEDQVNTLQTQLRQMKTEFEKYNTELQSLQTQRPVLAQQLQKQEQKAKTACANPAQVKLLKQKMEAKKAEYEKASAKSEEIQVQVDEINEQIKSKTDSKMRVINKEIADCSKMLETCKADIVKFKVGIKTAERNIKKSQEKIANLEQEKSEYETSLLAMQAERLEIEKDAAVLLENIEKVEGEICQLEEENSEITKKLTEINAKCVKLKEEQIEINQKIKTIKSVIGDKKNKLNVLKSKLSKLQIQEIPHKKMEELKTFTPEELEETQTRNTEIEIKAKEDEIKTMKPNLNSIKEYRQKEALYLERVTELDQITEKRNLTKTVHEELRKKRQDEFHSGFNLISYKLKEMYQMITLGGDAELEMVDSFDPFTEGVVLNVRPPKKSWKNITNLSGGEKTLSSLALVFALHYYKPSPLYFMDEIDAALDFKNVSIVGHYIKERTKNAQFIIISLRSNMFELADHLVGIYKTHDITKSVTVDLTTEQSAATKKSQMVNGHENRKSTEGCNQDKDDADKAGPSQENMDTSIISDSLVNGNTANDNENTLNGNDLTIDETLEMDTTE